MKELDKDVKDLYKKFIDYFGSDEVVTTNKYADDLIGMFNDFAEGEEREDFKDKIQNRKFINSLQYLNLTILMTTSLKIRSAVFHRIKKHTM